MLALSIRQPYAELILRGLKRIEYRSRPTKLIGQRFYIYAARKWGLPSRDREGAGSVLEALLPLGSSTTAPLPNGRGSDTLPTGVIVGSAVIAKCVKNCDGYEWHLSDVKRYKRPRRVKRQPQPVWFNPF